MTGAGASLEGGGASLDQPFRGRGPGTCWVPASLPPRLTSIVVSGRLPQSSFLPPEGKRGVSPGRIGCTAHHGKEIPLIDRSGCSTRRGRKPAPTCPRSG